MNLIDIGFEAKVDIKEIKDYNGNIINLLPGKTTYLLNI
jgi:hypothetical protein